MRRPPRKTSIRTAFSISLLTCIESRIMLTVLKFKVFDPILQSSFGRISCSHSIYLRSQQSRVLDSSSRKIQSKATWKASLHTQLTSLITYREDWVRANSCKPPIICILSSIRSASTWSTNLPSQEPFSKPRRDRQGTKKFKNTLDRAKGCLMCALDYPKAWNYMFHLNSSVHITMPKNGDKSPWKN